MDFKVGRQVTQHERLVSKIFLHSMADRRWIRQHDIMPLYLDELETPVVGKSRIRLSLRLHPRCGKCIELASSTKSKQWHQMRVVPGVG